MTPKEEEGFETITVRIPRALKEQVEQYTASRGESLTGVVREALQNMIAPRGRMFQLPGLSAEFESFQKSARRETVLLLVIDDRGERFMFCGRVLGNVTNESIITLNDAHGGTSRSHVILRRDVVGWFGDDLTKTLVANLRRDGWIPRTNTP